MLTRRSFTAFAVAAALSPMAGCLPAHAGADPSRRGSRLDRLVPEIDPVLDLHNPNTGEALRVRFYDATGYDGGAVRQVNWHLRDWRQKSVRQVDVRLYWALAAMRASAIKAGHSGRIQVNSGYRTPATNLALRKMGYKTASNSFHLKAQAIDMMVPGANVSDIADLARWLEIGGTGIYRNFVHMDSGPVREWRSG